MNCKWFHLQKWRKKKYLNLDFSGTHLLHELDYSLRYFHHTLLHFPTGNLRVFLAYSWGCWPWFEFSGKALVTWRLLVEGTQVSHSNQGKSAAQGFGGLVCLFALQRCRSFIKNKLCDFWEHLKQHTQIRPRISISGHHHHGEALKLKEGCETFLFVKNEMS